MKFLLEGGPHHGRLIEHSLGPCGRLDIPVAELATVRWDEGLQRFVRNTPVATYVDLDKRGIHNRQVFPVLSYETK